MLRGHSRRLELRPQVLPPVGRDRDRDVVQAAEHLGVVAEVQAGEVEEREEVAVADVEEEVGRALVVAVLEQLGERELEQALVEVDRPLDVAREQREVVQPTRRRRRARRPTRRGAGPGAHPTPALRSTASPARVIASPWSAGLYRPVRGLRPSRRCVIPRGRAESGPEALHRGILPLHDDIPGQVPSLRSVHRAPSRRRLRAGSRHRPASRTAPCRRSVMTAAGSPTRPGGS